MNQMQDEAGNIWEVDAQGNPVRLVQQAQSEQPPADPGFQYEGQQAEADLAGAQSANRGKNISNTVAEGTAPTTIGTNQAPAGYLWIDPNNPNLGVKPIPGYKFKGKEEGDKSESDKALAARRILEMIDGPDGISEQFEQNFRGGGLEALNEYNPLREANQVFDRKANSMLPFAKKLLRTPGEGAQSDKEAQDYRDQLPSSTARDATNEQLINDLRATAITVLENEGIDASSYKEGGGVQEPQPTKPVPQGEELPIFADPAQAGPDGTITNAAPNTPDLVAAPTTHLTTQAPDRYATENDKKAAAAYQSAVNKRLRRGDLSGLRSELLALNKKYYPNQKVEPAKLKRLLDGAQKTLRNGGTQIRIAPLESGITSTADKALSAVGNSAFGAVPIGLANSLTAGNLDEIAGAVFGEEAGKRAQFVKEQSRENSPVATLAGEVGGAIVGLNPLTKAAQGLGLGAKAAPLAADAVFGAAYGAGENNDNRLGGAAIGAGSALVGNQIGQHLLAPGARAIADTKIAQKGVNKFRGMFGGKPIAPPAKPDFAQKTLNKVGDVGQVRTDLEDAALRDLPFSLADADPKLRNIAGSASRKSPDVRALAEQTLQPRKLGQAERAIEGIGRDLAPPADIAKLGGEIKQQAQVAAQPLYDEAFSRAAPVSGEIADILQTPAGKKALKDAYDIAGNDGRNPLSMGFDLDAQGEVALQNLPSFETLDLVKRGFDDTLEGYRDPFTQNVNLDNQGRAVQGAKNRFVGELDRLNPKYKEARGAYEDVIKNKTALEQGFGATTARTPPRVMNDVISNTPEQRIPYLQQGFATKLADDAERIRLSGNPYKSIYGSPAQQQKVDALFPNAGSFGRQVELEDAMDKTAYELIGGSPTAARQAADDTFTSDAVQMGGEAALGLATGAAPITAAAQAGRKFLGDAGNLGLGKIAQKRAETVGPALINPDPMAALNALDAAQQAKLIRDIYKRKTGRAGGMFGGAIAAPLAVGQ